MANYAVAAAMAPYTPILVASETNEYGGMKYEVRTLQGDQRNRCSLETRALVRLLE